MVGSDRTAPGFRAKVGALLERQWVQRSILVLIIVNAVTLGLETSESAMRAAGGLLVVLDKAILVCFVAELTAKLYVQRLRFWKNAWNVFDFLVVAVALVPAAGPFSVLRALRVLRVLRLISNVAPLRRVVGGLLAALPGMGSIVLLISLLFYVFAVIATKLFGDSFPEWFGTIGASAYSLFQIMTLESWSMGIVRPVMETFPFAWLFFIPFILATTFTVLNLFVGVVVEAMQREHEAELEAERREAGPSIEDQRLAALTKEIQALRREVADLSARQGP
jgi:voltage-gated sodium channel